MFACDLFVRVPYLDMCLREGKTLAVSGDHQWPLTLAGVDGIRNHGMQSYSALRSIIAATNEAVTSWIWLDLIMM